MTGYRRSVSGLDHIASVFAHARAAGRAALMPYYTLGYPDGPTSEAVIRAMAKKDTGFFKTADGKAQPVADSEQLFAEPGVVHHASSFSRVSL